MDPGAVEAIRALMAAKRSARSERTRTAGQARSLIVASPGDLRARFAGHTVADRRRQAVNQLIERLA